MNINRNTYESFFLLYVDNELTSEERAAVEAFIVENPDLKEELVMLQGTVLKPENDAVFTDKNILLKGILVNPVNEQNYEEYFVEYGDNELTLEDKQFTEQFVYHHPQYQQEFELILKASLVPDNSIVFPDKELLYRREKDDKVIPFNYRRIAAAAVILFMVGGAVWYFSGNDINNGNQVAIIPSDPKHQESVKKTATENNTKQDTPSPETILTDTQEKPAPVIEIIAVPNRSNDYATKNNRIKKSDDTRNISPALTVQQENKDLAVNKIKKDAVTEAATIQAHVSNQAGEKHIVDVEVSANELQQTNQSELATQASYIDADQESGNDIIYVANTSLNKKNKLRGVFRKASRLFEKATNLDPTDNGRGIRIANFEIAIN